MDGPGRGVWRPATAPYLGAAADPLRGRTSMRLPPCLALWVCLVIAQGCRTHPSAPPEATPTGPTATARPLALATPEAIEFEFGRPQATACNCFSPNPSATDGWVCATPRFGAYLLALTWAPNFCPGHPDKEQCEQLAGSFAATHLTLHGLWPQFNDAEAEQQKCMYPAFCGGLCECRSSAAPARCFPDPATIPEDMGKYGPGYVTDNFFLANHEWPKHGSCTGMDSRTYFTSTIEALKSLPGDEGTPAVLRDNIGKGVALEELISAFDVRGSVAFRCDERCNLAEVGACFGVGAQGKPTTRIPCPQNVMTSSTNSCVGNPQRPRCPTVSIQAVRPDGGGGGEPAPTCGQPGQGPACTSDDTCRTQGFVRCAKSGCCTTVPKR
ncbi:hypothetical protein D7V93_05285 [Corallococcus llansteffanensis]|uniref:Uncharacterized protein n=2 Tax=Corallococcus llansteffanensis TaxID=2316731 RepID=A0A3A8QB55_9BACT|nr:hypothetical protein D7V93_05285 [Corallococcus llansteffanensis]